MEASPPNNKLQQDELETLMQWGKEYLWMQGERASDLQANNKYHIIVGGSGYHIFDANGKKYIDGNASGFAKAVGHGRKEIREAMFEQAKSLSYTPNSFGQVTLPAIRLAKKLAEIMPGTLKKTFFCTSGSHAIEVAIQIAKQYQSIRGRTRKFKIISRRPEYHGSTYATMSLGARNDRNSAIFEPLMAGVLQVSAPHCNRCPWKRTPSEPGSCCNLALEELKQIIDSEGPETIAAIVATPLRIGGSLPPSGYWTEVRRLCDLNEILLVSDEVSVGMGRLGSWLGIEQFDIVPDIAAISKGLTSGELPAGAVIASKEVAETFDDAPAKLGQVQHGSTFGAHPIVMAAALRNIEIIEQENLLMNSKVLGSLLYEELSKMVTRHPSVEYVEGGVGLLASVSLVSNRTTGKRYSADALACLERAVRANGLSLRINNTINITPPLSIDEEGVRKIVEILDLALSTMESEYLTAK